MTVSLSDGVTTVTPMLMLGWESTSASRNVLHQILGTSEPYVSLQPADTETMTMDLLCSDVTQGYACYQLLKSGLVLVLTVDDPPTLSMSLVLSGQATRRLDSDTLIRWIVSAEVTQVG